MPACLLNLPRLFPARPRIRLVMTRGRTSIRSPRSSRSPGILRVISIRSTDNKLQNFKHTIWAVLNSTHHHFLLTLTASVTVSMRALIYGKAIKSSKKVIKRNSSSYLRPLISSSVGSGFWSELSLMSTPTITPIITAAIVRIDSRLFFISRITRPIFNSSELSGRFGLWSVVKTSSDILRFAKLKMKHMVNVIVRRFVAGSKKLIYVHYGAKIQTPYPAIMKLLNTIY